MPRRPSRALDAYHSLLGTMPDGDIAKKAGVSRALVVKTRQKMGIGPFGGGPGRRRRVPSDSVPAPRPVPVRGRRSKLDPYVHLLGKETDTDIAGRAGVTPENVRAYRLRRGIGGPGSAARTQAASVAPPLPGRAAVEAALQGARENAMTAELAAWSVSVDTGRGTRTYAVVADSVASAARLAVQRAAAKHPGAMVTAVARVAAMLE